MAYFELDTTLSPETKAMLKEVTHFARKVMSPAGIELDKLHRYCGYNPQHRYAEGTKSRHEKAGRDRAHLG